MGNGLVLYDNKVLLTSEKVKFRLYGQKEDEVVLKILRDIAINFDGKEPDKTLLEGNLLFLKSQFFELSIEDVIIAIDMACSGSLGQIDTDKMSFGKRMLGKVLSAYRKYKRAQLSMFVKNKAEKERQEILQPVTKDEAYAKSLHADCLKWVRNRKEVPLIADWNAIYEYLENKGRINLTKDEKEMFAENVKASMLEEAGRYQVKLNRLDYHRVIDRMANPKDFKTECRKKYLQDVYYSKLCNFEKE